MASCIISIQGKQQCHPDDAPDGIEFITNGEYHHEEDRAVFSYQESEVTGLEGTKTTFCVSPDLVTLIREGTLNTQMVFEPGKRHVFLYETPFGATSMGIDTRRISAGLDPSGGELQIDYTIHIDSAVISQNSFVIRVKKSAGNA